MLAIEYIKIELYSLLIGLIMFEHGDKIDPLWMYDRIIDFLFKYDIVELIEILEELVH